MVHDRAWSLLFCPKFRARILVHLRSSSQYAWLNVKFLNNCRCECVFADHVQWITKPGPTQQHGHIHCLLNSVMFKHEAVCISQKKPSPPVPSLYWVCFSLFRWATSRKISGQEPIFTQTFSFTFLYIIHYCVRATSFSNPPVYCT